LIKIDLTAVRKAHAQLLAQTSAAIILELADAGKFAVDYVKAHPTFKPRSGELQAKTQWIPYKGRAIKIQNSAAHAHAIDGGAKPHVIRPRRARTLAFKVKGKLVFARKVNHPGNKPFKFLYRATTAAGRILHQGLASRMDRIAAKF
jgi:hypothetical protein